MLLIEMRFANGYFVDKYTYKLKSVCSITTLVFQINELGF